MTVATDPDREKHTSGPDRDLRALSIEDRERLMVDAAKRYYDLEQTMGEVALSLGLTRWQVGRLLRDARAQDVVRIEIRAPGRRLPELEIRLQRRWRLQDAVVVPADANGVAREAARFLAAMHPSPKLLGVSWGRTMAAVAHALPPHWNPGAEIVLLNGAVHVSPTLHRTNNVAELFARAAGGRATLLPVPAVVGRADTSRVLQRDPVIASVLERGRAAPVACFGVGGTDPDSVLVQSGAIGADELARLRDAGAVGDVLGRFIDRNGRVVDAELDARTIGLELTDLAAKRVAIGVASGPAKHDVVAAALRAGLLDVLVTDEDTAVAVAD